jgi:hypothetical protein
MGIPENAMTMFVRMPPPTPANPDTAPIPNPARWPEAAARRVLEHRLKPSGSGKAHRYHETKYGKGSGQNRAAQVRRYELGDDYPDRDARPPLAQKGQIDIAGAPVTD